METPAVQAQNLRKVYGKLEAVADATFSLLPGEIVGFLGPNGAGKTTTIKLLTGLLEPTAGRAFILGHDIQKEPIPAKAAFGYVPDNPNLYGKLTGREFLKFMSRLYRVPQDRAEHRDQVELLPDHRAADVPGAYGPVCDDHRGHRVHERLDQVNAGIGIEEVRQVHGRASGQNGSADTSGTSRRAPASLRPGARGRSDRPCAGQGGGGSRPSAMPPCNSPGIPAREPSPAAGNAVSARDLRGCS